MADLQTLRSNISTYLARTDINTEIDLAINRAIDFYEKSRFWFNETTGTFSTVASQQSYGSSDSIPTDIAEIDVVSLTQSSSNIYSLFPRTYQYIKAINTGGSTHTGPPVDFAYYANKFWFYPTPDAVYTVTVSYQKEYSDLSANSGSNDFTDNAQDLIESRASWWLALNMLRDFQLAEGAKSMERDALKALQKKSQNMTTSGRVRPTSF